MKTQLLAAAFIPWLSFVSKPGMTIADHTHTHIGFAKNCSKLKATDDRVFIVEIVNTRESRALGLGGRRPPLAKNEGMLFAFSPPEAVAFWMKDTRIPLEIVYVAPNGKLGKIYEMSVEKDPAHPDKTYPSNDAVIAAVEIAPNRLVGTDLDSLSLCVEAK